MQKCIIVGKVGMNVAYVGKTYFPSAVYPPGIQRIEYWFAFQAHMSSVLTIPCIRKLSLLLDVMQERYHDFQVAVHAQGIVTCFISFC